MVKSFFHILLGIYIFSLTILPCVDMEHGASCVQTEDCASVPAQDHHDMDSCSPFCTCQCCQANFFISEYVVSATPISLDIVHYELTPNLQSIEIFDYFIPPKV